MRSALGKVSEKTRQRCAIVRLRGSKDLKKYRPVGLELFHFLYTAEQLTFALYFRIEDLMIEFIRPPEFSKELLDQLWRALLKTGEDVDLCVLKSEEHKFHHFLGEVRRRKIRELLYNYPHLDEKILLLFEQLSSASQMVVKGGINAEVANAVEQSARHLVDNLLDSDSAIGTISRMITCDATLYDHSATVAMFASIIGSRLLDKKLSPRETQIVAQCGLYHDVGKTCVPSAILNKPGRFTVEEFNIMKTHTTLGETELAEAIRKGAPINPLAVRIAGEHHENFCGNGYPRGRAGRLEEDSDNGIHLFTRIVTVADVYSALLMKRVYKDAMEPHEALRVMTECAEKFDPVIFSKFIRNVVESLNLLERKAGSERGRILRINESGQLEIVESALKACSS